MIRWAPSLAYAIGLITTDGCLSKDGRHIDLTSKDLEQIENFSKILGLKNKVGLKMNGYSSRQYYRIQFGDVKFYQFLLRIGLTPHKSKTLNSLTVPNKYFRDFLRGLLDGDGHIRTYWDPDKINGKITQGSRAFRLIVAKYSSIVLLKEIYHKNDVPCLTRKYSKYVGALKIINTQRNRTV